MAAHPLDTPSNAGTTQKRADGVWRLTADGSIIAVCDGPATLLVPTESVRVLVVELPIRSAAKRLEALPYAIEDRIADPLDAVHLAMGPGIGGDRYRVGVVRHAVMREWTALADAAGLGHAAMVPDALALPEPPTGEWAIGMDGQRALVRDGEGAAFALPVQALTPAWRAAGAPAVLADGDQLPPELAALAKVLTAAEPSVALASPGLDLRQGAWPRQSVADPHLRRLFWILAIGVGAHVAIAGADTAMTRVIAERRAADTRVLVQQFAPGTPVDGDLADRVTAMLPAPGSGGGNDRFLPKLSRLAAALQPVVPAGSVRSVRLQGDAMILVIDGDAALAGGIERSLRAASVAGTAISDGAGAVTVTSGA
ncbi:type II secretion system protein GspL [Sphingomonas sp. CJ99]